LAYLSAAAEAAGYDVMAAVQDLAAKGGPGPLRQAMSLIRLSLGKYKVRPEEYFTYALWRRDRGQAFVRDFISNHRMRAFNNSLNMPARGLAHDLVNDKLGTEALLAARGLPVAKTLAAYAPPGADLPDLPYLRPLRSQGELETYLSEPTSFPVFGKPRADSFARGAAAMTGLAGDESVRFLTGESVPIAGLAAEIVRDWQQGYLFQPFYNCEATLRPHVGEAMASLRIVTLWTAEGIEPWYAVIRLPAKAAMHDGDAKGTRIWGLVNLEAGRIEKLRSLRDPHAGDLRHGNDPEQEFLGYKLPHWAEAVEMCRAGHESFPGHGIIGWDVFLTDEGAILNEANASPGHLYQAAAQKPLLNPDMRPAYERALAFAVRHGGKRGEF
jgi:Sugar-transfer associated ATP-grasp